MFRDILNCQCPYIKDLGLIASALKLRTRVKLFAFITNII